MRGVLVGVAEELRAGVVRIEGPVLADLGDQVALEAVVLRASEGERCAVDGAVHAPFNGSRVAFLDARVDGPGGARPVVTHARPEDTDRLRASDGWVVGVVDNGVFGEVDGDVLGRAAGTGSEVGADQIEVGRHG